MWQQISWLIHALSINSTSHKSKKEIKLIPPSLKVDPAKLKILVKDALYKSPVWYATLTLVVSKVDHSWEKRVAER